MKGFECEICGTELQYEQIEGMRIKRVKVDENGKYIVYFPTYCPTCNEYFEKDK